MTTPNDWTAAEAARLSRFTEPDEEHDYDCDCAKCLLERLIASCEGEVGE